MKTEIRKQETVKYVITPHPDPEKVNEFENLIIEGTEDYASHQINEIIGNFRVKAKDLLPNREIQLKIKKERIEI